MSKATEDRIKFVVEYKDDKGKVVARWHYDYTKNKFGPVLTEDLDLPKQEKKKAKSK